jgi:hypothetical protein
VPASKARMVIGSSRVGFCRSRLVVVWRRFSEVVGSPPRGLLHAAIRRSVKSSSCVATAQA